MTAIALFILLVVLPTGALSGLIWWRFKGSGRTKVEALVATRNHPSLRTFHYGPALVVEPAVVAAPPLAPGSPLAHLMPAEDFRANEEQKTPAGAIRREAEPTAARAAAEPASPETTGAAASQAATNRNSTARPAAAGVVSALDVLGTDEQPGPEPAAASIGDDSIAESLFDNPLTQAANTRNDAANRLAAVELRQRRRAAVQAGSLGQKSALNALYPGHPAPAAR